MPRPTGQGLGHTQSFPTFTVRKSTACPQNCPNLLSLVSMRGGAQEEDYFACFSNTSRGRELSQQLCCHTVSALHHPNSHSDKDTEEEEGSLGLEAGTREAPFSLRSRFLNTKNGGSNTDDLRPSSSKNCAADMLKAWYKRSLEWSKSILLPNILYYSVTEACHFSTYLNLWG